MTRAELVQEVVDRGYNYVAPVRIGKFIDRAYRKICSRYPWPFLEASTTGVASFEIADLGKVLSVSANETPLPGRDRRWAAGVFPDLTQTGAATFWYLENRTLKVFPVDTAEVTVRYIKRPATLADSDTPVMPEEWQHLLVDFAVIHCLKDDDEVQEGQVLRAEWREELAEMVHAELGPNYQNAEVIIRTGEAGDYL
ncbi:MAG TPA: hypothetical protein VFJ76_07730 [Solirubrobacterales bacterium]|nr:hypothetical protein [Solirubrobacterales bacterium]